MRVSPRPVGPRLLVKPMEAVGQTSAGIILPEDAMAKECRGVVLAAGEGWFLWGYGSPEDDLQYRALPVKVGDEVVWAAKAGIKIRLDTGQDGHAEDLIILEIAEVLLVLDAVTEEAVRQ